MLRAVPVLGLLALSGCGSLLSESATLLAGVTGAGVAGSVTKDAAVAAGIGLGTQSLAREGVRYLERRVHRTEQDAIADAAGPLQPGAVGRWAVEHSLPLEPDQGGQVVVSRAFGAGSFQCKEIVFSVERGRGDDLRSSFYVATVCQDGGAWRWASAEPAVARWGGLQ